MDDWMRDWPQEPGYFWFYGSDNHMRKGYRRLYPVVVERVFPPAADKDQDPILIYRYLGGKLSPANGATGVWLAMSVPEIPAGGTRS